ncbi:hypothetical protein PSHT_00098 [Puccinia striiformis]|uniref:Uncharacterized protein n=1 Tax=Puccinia striiformis TaxID=27350 RepID=A0A2S4WP49_9BASI|nr:hypothetical protein PSHT_00098 [Puccinia striiformis]
MYIYRRKVRTIYNTYQQVGSINELMTNETGRLDGEFFLTELSEQPGFKIVHRLGKVKQTHDKHRRTMNRKGCVIAI